MATTWLFLTFYALYKTCFSPISLYKRCAKIVAKMAFFLIIKAAKRAIFWPKHVQDSKSESESTR